MGWGLGRPPGSTLKRRVVFKVPTLSWRIPALSSPRGGVGRVIEAQGGHTFLHWPSEPVAWSVTETSPSHAGASPHTHSKPGFGLVLGERTAHSWARGPGSTLRVNSRPFSHYTVFGLRIFWRAWSPPKS